MLPVLLAVLLTACGGLSGEPRIVATIPPPPTAAPVSLPAAIQPNIAAGERIYVERCAGCHGLGGAGDGELVVSGQVARQFPSWMLLSCANAHRWAGLK
ncbi:cytochrome c [Oscillatoria laete-virens NRMC-F 0139]|nr:cytochrome c [Oscillatoria laete-virens]MDL5054884.1 cytochrome c [Oscillatoria laete-virens NRMC-F 0139]